MSSSHSTPSKSSKATPSSRTNTRGNSSRSSSRLFTPSMQDRQARNKDPYSSSEESSDSGWSGAGGRKEERFTDSYENMQRRREAAVVLDNPELLMMHAQARCDSIPGTRHYFTKLLLGFEDGKDVYPAKQVLKPVVKEKIGQASGSKRVA